MSCTKCFLWFRRPVLFLFAPPGGIPPVMIKAQSGDEGGASRTHSKILCRLLKKRPGWIDIER